MPNHRDLLNVLASHDYHIVEAPLHDVVHLKRSINGTYLRFLSVASSVHAAHLLRVAGFGVEPEMVQGMLLLVK